MLPIVPYRPGDIVAFSRRDWLGCAINLGTWGIPGWGASHVAIVGRLKENKRQLVLWESTSMAGQPCLIQRKDVSGVQAQDITTRINGYPGRVWHYPLNQPLDTKRISRLNAFCQKFLGNSYDAIGAFRSRGLSLIEKVIFRPPDMTSVFCSEFCAAGHKHIGLFQNNESRMNPNKFIRHECHAHVLAKPRRKK